MKYPKVDLKVWTDEFDLHSKARPCLNCGKLLEKTIPFQYDQVRGLKSAPHGCPKQYDHTISMTLDETENEMLRDFFRKVK